MRKLSTLFVVFILFTASFSLHAQKAKVEKALLAYDAGEYYDAIDLLKDAYDMVNDKDDKTEMIFKIAECYRHTNDMPKAELWYKKAIARDYQNPLAVLYYGQALKENGNYEDAINQFKRYKELVPEDPRGADGVLSCELAQQWLENPNGYQVEEVRMIDSRDNDYAPAYARDDYLELYFTSSRAEATGDELHGATGQNFSDIFVTRMDRKGKWSTPVPLGENINTEFEDGAPSLNTSFNVMYFTRCQVSKNKAMGCEIYESKRSGDEWSKAQSLELAGDSIVIAHPAISPNELTLYFVSDMPGGYGGKDLYKVTRDTKSGEWGNMENMGPEINTPGDEVFPYVHPDGTLYFSSNGQIGMGGLDIFKATKKDDGTWKIENMRYPINSPADDFGIVFQKDVEAGFLSSSRDSRGIDNLFSFVLPPLKFSITGYVKDEKTDESLSGATVKSIGSDGVTLEAKTEKDGSFKFMLKPATDYVFIASHEGYLNGKERETTKGLDKSQDFNTTIYLASIEKPIELPNIFYDFAKWDLRPESMVSLDKLVETLNDNPNVTIELMSHTDSRGSAEANIELSQKRAQSVVDYLIKKGIAPDRLTAKGYGESQPKVVDEKIHEQYPAFPVGAVLNDKYINSLPSDDLKEIAYQINRRTEFQVLRTDYQPHK